MIFWRFPIKLLSDYSGNHKKNVGWQDWMLQRLRSRYKGMGQTHYSCSLDERNRKRQLCCALKYHCRHFYVPFFSPTLKLSIIFVCSLARCAILPVFCVTAFHIPLPVLSSVVLELSLVSSFVKWATLSGSW